MDVLLVLNESRPGDHGDVHRAVSKIKADGRIRSYVTYPFPYRLSQAASHQDVNREIVRIAEEHEVTAILWAHASDLKVHEQTIKQLRELKSAPVMGYWDADIYQRFYKPVPENVRYIADRSNVVFCPGLDRLALDAKRDHKDVRYVPLSVDHNLFSRKRKLKADYTYDIAMIGNNVESRIPFKTFPGSRLRSKLADLLRKKLGDRFVIFGQGWMNPSAKGVLEFDKQSDIYEDSRVMLGVNNLFADYYFSNRLPIAMAAGIITVHNYEKGVEEIFRGEQPPYFFRTIEEAWDIIKKLLDKDQQELDEMAMNSQRYALSSLTTESILIYMLEVLDNYKRSGNGLPMNELPNPWINACRL